MSQPTPTPPSPDDVSHWLWEDALRAALNGEVPRRSSWLDVSWIRSAETWRETGQPWNYPFPSFNASSHLLVLYRGCYEEGRVQYRCYNIDLSWWAAAGGGSSPADSYTTGFVGKSDEKILDPVGTAEFNPSTFTLAAGAYHNARLWAQLTRDQIHGLTDQIDDDASAFKGTAAQAFLRVLLDLQDELTMLVEDMDTTKNWESLLLDSGSKATAFLAELYNAWIDYKKNLSPSALLQKVAFQLRWQCDDIETFFLNNPGLMARRGQDSWITDHDWNMWLNFDLDSDEWNKNKRGEYPPNRPSSYFTVIVNNAASIKALNDIIQNRVRGGLQTLDQRMQNALKNLVDSYNFSTHNLHDLRAYLNRPVEDPQGTGNDPDNVPPPGDVPPPPGEVPPPPDDVPPPVDGTPPPVGGTPPANLSTDGFGGGDDPFGLGGGGSGPPALDPSDMGSGGGAGGLGGGAGLGGLNGSADPDGPGSPGALPPLGSPGLPPLGGSGSRPPDDDSPGSLPGGVGDYDDLAEPGLGAGSGVPGRGAGDSIGGSMPALNDAEGAAGAFPGLDGAGGVGGDDGWFSDVPGLAASLGAPDGGTPGAAGVNSQSSLGSMPPMMPPMMPPTGGMGGGNQDKERDRTTWLAEEEEVWGTDPDVGPAVIGRDEVPDQSGGQAGRPGIPRTPGGPQVPARGGARTGARGY